MTKQLFACLLSSVSVLGILPIVEGRAFAADKTAHWAFRALDHSAPPQVKDDGWVRNPIDRFILARLESKGIRPAPEADRYTLIKRLQFDLLGTLPDPAEVSHFVNDASPDAYERLVDRLLASPRFGERFGRHWLDLARYADSDGFEKDRARPDAFIYRDWVINAFNRDLRYDQFTIEQLAGDLLPNPSDSQLIATAFHRQTLTNEEGGVDQEEFRIAAVFDRTETTGIVWLGLTVGCARCHNHKYDPISQREYYQLFSFFNTADEVTVKVPVKATDLAEFERRRQPLLEALAARKAELAAQEQRWEQDERARLLAHRGAPLHLPAEILNALEMYPEKRVASTQQLLFDHFASQDERIRELTGQLEAVRREFKVELMSVRTIAQSLRERRTRRFERGDFLSPAEEVHPEVPAMLPTLKYGGKQPTRLDLARWLVSKENPLTPRVAVNDLWGHLFGAGLVKTSNDFGTRGEPPSHPELLDWLAATYRDKLGWSNKALIRLVVTSATYRQESSHRPELSELDPQNRLLARQNRPRVEGEVVRDLALDAGGLLAQKIGGPSVFPPMPPDLASLSYANNFTWKESSGLDRYRRGMYTFFKRTIPHPTLTTFDCPDANVANVKRTVSNTPLQALTLLNNESFVEAAQALARRMLADRSGSDEERLARALQHCLIRPASAKEVQRFTGLLDSSRKYYRAHPEAARNMAGKLEKPSSTVEEVAAWTATVRIILNLDEFITRE